MGYHNFKKTLAFKLCAVFTAALPPAYHWLEGNLTPVPAAADQRTDAIVVFTGGNDRIEHGQTLFAQGMAKWLMISGMDKAHPHRMEAEYAQAFSTPSIHLDFEAKNTIQNARNASDWVKTMNVHSVRLVTSEDHMPRAYFELRRLLPTSVTLVADALPGNKREREMDSEINRLLCRTYETALDVTFCYGARKMLRDWGLR